MTIGARLYRVEQQVNLYHNLFNALSNTILYLTLLFLPTYAKQESVGEGQERKEI